MFSISLNSCKDNEQTKKMNKFVAELNDLLGYLTSEENASLADAEIRVSDTFRSLAQTLLEVCVSIEAGKKVSEPVPVRCATALVPRCVYRKKIFQRFVGNKCASLGISM